MKSGPFAQRGELDEVHSAASFLLDWDWLVVDDALTELGYLTKTTAAAPATSSCVKIGGSVPMAAVLARGGGGVKSPRKGR